MFYIEEINHGTLETLETLENGSDKDVPVHIRLIKHFEHIPIPFKIFFFFFFGREQFKGTLIKY